MCAYSLTLDGMLERTILYTSDFYHQVRFWVFTTPVFAENYAFQRGGAAGQVNFGGGNPA